MDFKAGRIYAATANKDALLSLRDLLNDLGCQVVNLKWNFNGLNWTDAFLKKIYETTQFKQEFNTRADELTRFRPDEVVKLDDRMMERIVSKYFALSEMPSGLWCALAPNAALRLHKGSNLPTGLAYPSQVTDMLNSYPDASITSSTVIFQEYSSRTRKTGALIRRYRDMFSLELNENCMVMDAGAALLRAFDLPTFKNKMMRRIKDEGRELEISCYWESWLKAMDQAIYDFVDNVVDTLEISHDGCGLVEFNGVQSDEIPVTENAVVEPEKNTPTA
jgi:hypothetical protein